MGVSSSLKDNSNVGNVERYIDTAYDKVKIVADNIDALLHLEEHFKELDGNYLGNFVGEPTLRPDLEPLQDGDGYFNTTLNLYYVYVDGTWIQQTIYIDDVALASAIGAGPFNVWIAYAEDAIGTGISTVPSATKKYIGIANNKTTNTVDIGNPGVFAWYYAEGPTGPLGNTGAAGPTTYLHIAYANSPDGAVNFNFVGGTHIGLLSNTTVTPSGAYADYTWTTVSVVLGAPGVDGLDGEIVVELPTIPTGVSVDTTASAVKVTWATPTYEGHWYTKVYKTTWDGITYPSFSEGFFVNAVRGDYIDLSVSSDSNYLYWLRHVNLNAVESALAGGNGFEANTGLSYSDQLDWLTEDNMDPSLVTRLALIDSTLINGELGLYGAFAAMDIDVAGLNTSVGTLTTTGQTTITDLDSLDTEFNLLKTVVGDENAGLFYEVGLNTTSGAANFAAIALNLTSIGGLHAQFTVKINNNGHISGFGLASTTSPYDDQVHSEFAVVADTFIIAHPDSTEFAPFVVDGGTVYMENAFIKDASILTAKIADAQITNAKIGNTIQSTNFEYTAGVSAAGWKLDKTGAIQANAISIFDATGNLVLAAGIEAGDIENSSQTWGDIVDVPAEVIQTFFQASAPVSGFNPGDWWYDTDDDKAYRRNDGDTTWELIQDADIASALADASTAQSTADGKITTFYQTSAPTAEGDGDLWVDTDDDNQMYVWDINAGPAAWVSVRDLTIAAAQSDASQAITDAATAQGSADGKVTTFVGSSTPTAEGIGDLWLDDGNGNVLKRWNGSIWDPLQDDDIATAISDALTAQSTADGKIVSFYQTGVPTGAVGDLWTDTDDDNKLYRHNGGTAGNINDWDSVRDPTAIWADVSGVGIPDDGATVGATSSNYTGGIGVNLTHSNFLLDYGIWSVGSGGGTGAGTWNIGASGVDTLTSSTDLYQMDGSGTLAVWLTTAGLDSTVDAYGSRVTAASGEEFEVSCLLNNHRGTSQLKVRFYQSNDNIISTTSVDSVSTSTGGGSARTVANFDLRRGFVTAPALTSYCRIVVSITSSATTSCWGFYAQPYLGRTSVGQTEHSQFTHGPVTNKIRPGNVGTYIADATIDTAQIANAAIENAQIGLLAVDTAEIAVGAIETAKIGDLQVDTIKVANEAITTLTSDEGTDSTLTSSYPGTAHAEVTVTGEIGDELLVLITGTAFKTSYGGDDVEVSATVELNGVVVGAMTNRLAAVNGDSGALSLATVLQNVRTLDTTSDDFELFFKVQSGGESNIQIKDPTITVFKRLK